MHLAWGLTTESVGVALEGMASKKGARTSESCTVGDLRVGTNRGNTVRIY